MGAPFSGSAGIYDLLYEAAGKDYASEAAELHALIRQRNPDAATLLDVACGTGAHLRHLRRWYEVEGVDIEPSMLEQAQRRLPDVQLHRADMRALELERRFDAVVCLFSSIGYMRTTAELNQAIEAMAAQLAPGGVLIVDGWVRPEAWRDPGSVHALAARADETAVARVGVSRRDGRRTNLAMHHLIGTPGGIEHVVENHEMTLFETGEYRDGFERVGLSVEIVASPMPERDRYIGMKAPSAVPSAARLQR